MKSEKSQNLDTNGAASRSFHARPRAPRIALILPKMSINGVQRVNLQLAVGFKRLGLDVDVVTSDPTGTIAKEIPKGIGLFPIARLGKPFFFVDMVKYLRRRKPTHVLSSYDDVSIMVLVAKSIFNLDFFALVASHNSIVGSHHHPRKRWRNLIIEICIRRWYAHADALVAVSEGLATELTRTFGIAKGTVSVNYNPIIPDNFRELANQHISCDLPLEVTDRVIGFFGRLERQKNVRALIEAFALIQDLRDCKLLIVGEGEQKRELFERVRALDLADKVVFHPFVDNPFPLMRRCSLVVLPSIYEGFGNVLVEAMACGTQVIATDCHYGPSEILENGELGQLVPPGDAAALAHAIRRSLTKEFFVPTQRLIAESMNYTVNRSISEYLLTLGISCQSNS